MAFRPSNTKAASSLPATSRFELCLNGHEWAKQQLVKASIAFTTLDNGFLGRTAVTSDD